MLLTPCTTQCRQNAKVVQRMEDIKVTEAWVLDCLSDSNRFFVYSDNCGIKL